MQSSDLPALLYLRLWKKRTGRLFHCSLHFTRALIWRCHSIVRYMKTVFSCFSIDIVDSSAVIDAYIHPRHGEDAPPALLRPLRSRHWQLHLTADCTSTYRWSVLTSTPHCSCLPVLIVAWFVCSCTFSPVSGVAASQSAAAPPPPCFLDGASIASFVKRLAYALTLVL